MLNWFMYSFPDSGSLISNEIIKLHDYVMMILLGVLLVLMYLMIYMMMNYSLNRSMIHGHLMEVIWTIIPMILLLMVAFPSLKLLYKMDNLIDGSKLTVKVMGNQWFWTYELEDFSFLKSKGECLKVELMNDSKKNVSMDVALKKEKFMKDLINSNLSFKEFESYMLTDYSKGMFRLLDVDNRLILPFKTNIRLVVSSNDVIHSWAVPSLGVKIDAVPGRLNQVQINMNKVGLFFGQCSEICGLNHSFMPIVIESVTLKKFVDYMMNDFDIVMLSDELKQFNKLNLEEKSGFWHKYGYTIKLTLFVILVNILMHNLGPPVEMHPLVLPPNLEDICQE